jgi:ABC-type Fe3+-siderophore transport system permease subunit
MNTQLNIFFIFLFYYFIIFSITGFGLFFSSVIFKKNTNFNIGYNGIFGLFFVSIYSYISSNFFSHSFVHNLLFNFVGIFLFIYYFLTEKKKE